MVCWHRGAHLYRLWHHWGEPERAPHYRGLREHVHRPTDRPGDQPTDRPTDRPCPSHSRDTETLHVPTLPSRHATLMYDMWTVHCVVEIATRLRTPTMGKRKQRHPRNELRGWNERETSEPFILALPCRCRHASLGFTYVSFSRRLLHTNPFSHFPT